MKQQVLPIISKEVACRRLSALGLRQSQVYQILSQVQKWVDAEGPENTVKRLKVFKNLFVRKWSKAEPITPTWIKFKLDSEGYAIPKGIFGSLFIMGKKSQKMLSALMVYTTYQSNRVLPSQWKKFYESVRADNKYLCRFESSRNFGIFKSKLIAKGWRHSRSIKLDGTVLVPNRTRAPLLDGRKTVVESDDGNLTRLVNFGCHADPRTSKLIRKLKANPMNFIRVIESNYPLGCQDLVSGKIGFIQEPGLKLRAVANPLRHHQFVLEPLKRDLLRVLSFIEADCTHNQEKGIFDIQSWLKEGMTLSSVDLSDATNLFPGELTFNLLGSLYQGTDYELLVAYFKEISLGDWTVNPSMLPEKDSCSKINWSKGQPLGLGPSFPAFALSHHFIMMGVEHLLRRQGVLGPTETLKYRILGDDIVLDARAEEAYHKIMVDDLGCSISIDKSLSKCSSAEFASRIIRSDKILRQYKWRDYSDDNFIEMARQYGTRQSFGLFPKKQRQVLKSICDVPDQFGGLGFNPKGVSLDNRISRNLLLIRKLESSDRGVSQRWAGTYRLKNMYEAMPHRTTQVVWDASTSKQFFGRYPDKGISVQESETPPPNFFGANVKSDTLFARLCQQ